MLNELPVRQKNANLTDEFVMRVGIPHSGGRLAAHAADQGYHVMVSASAFWDRKHERFHMPEHSPLHTLDFALDSAGYTAITNFQRKGRQAGIAGIFPWSYSQYLEFATLAGASWYSQPDLCTEEGAAKDATEVDYRIRATATLLEGILQILYAWQNELAKTCNSSVVANLLPPPVPVIQGRSISDYKQSLDLLRQVWARWEPWLAPPALIGVGSMCRRDLRCPKEGLLAILNGLRDDFPKGAHAHVFGAKNTALNELPKMDFVISSDSMAYDFGARVKAHKQGVSNTIERRSVEMTEWMRAAMARVTAASGNRPVLCN